MGTRNAALDPPKSTIFQGQSDESGWWFGTSSFHFSSFFSIGNFTITDEVIFYRGVETNLQGT